MVYKDCDSLHMQYLDKNKKKNKKYKILEFFDLS